MHRRTHQSEPSTLMHRRPRTPPTDPRHPGPKSPPASTSTQSGHSLDQGSRFPLTRPHSKPASPMASASTPQGRTNRRPSSASANKSSTAPSKSGKRSRRQTLARTTPHTSQSTPKTHSRRSTNNSQRSRTTKTAPSQVGNTSPTAVDCPLLPLHSTDPATRDGSVRPVFIRIHDPPVPQYTGQLHPPPKQPQPAEAPVRRVSSTLAPPLTPEAPSRQRRWRR